MAIRRVDQPALIQHHVIGLRRGAPARGLGNEETDLARLIGVCDIDDAQAGREPHRIDERAVHRLMILVRAKARTLDTREGRVAFADLEESQRLDRGGIGDIEGREAGMQAAAPQRFLGCALSLIFLVDRDRDAAARDARRHRHHRVCRLGKRRMIVVGAERARRRDVSTVDHEEAAVPAARPELVAKAQRVM